jgi:hypothetical protein
MSGKTWEELSEVFHYTIFVADGNEGTRIG